MFVMPTALALDIGGGGARAGLVAPDGLTGQRTSAELSRDLDQDTLVASLCALLAAADPGDAADAIGVSVPAFIDKTGTVVHAANLPALDGVRLDAALGPVSRGRRLIAVPDLAAGALAESRLGAGRGIDRFLCVGLGTGANAAMVCDGHVLETAFGCFGDAGHVCVYPDGPVCSCGGVGCLEAVASGFALRREGAPHGWRSGREVIDAARGGHPAAVAILQRAGIGLGRAIATWAAIVWPSRVAVAGGLCAAGDLLLGPARDELTRVGSPYIVKQIEVVAATLQRDASLVGAGLVSLDRINGAKGDGCG